MAAFRSDVEPHKKQKKVKTIFQAPKLSRLIDDAISATHLIWIIPAHWKLPACCAGC